MVDSRKSVTSSATTNSTSVVVLSLVFRDDDDTTLTRLVRRSGTITTSSSSSSSSSSASTLAMLSTLLPRLAVSGEVGGASTGGDNSGATSTLTCLGGCTSSTADGGDVIVELSARSLFVITSVLAAGRSSSLALLLLVGEVLAAARAGLGLGVLLKDGLVALPALLPVETTAAFLADPGLAVEGVAARLRRDTAGEAVIPPPPLRPFTAGLAALPRAATGGEVLAVGAVALPLDCCCFSDLLEAFEGVRLNGSRLGGETVGRFLERLAAAGGVRLAEGSLAENWERAGVVVAFLREGGEEGGRGDSSTRCT